MLFDFEIGETKAINLQKKQGFFNKSIQILKFLFVLADDKINTQSTIKKL